MTDTRALVISGVWTVGYICALLPSTTAGTVCVACLSFLTGVVARRLLERAGNGDER